MDKVERVTKGQGQGGVAGLEGDQEAGLKGGAALEKGLDAGDTDGAALEAGNIG